MPGWPQNSIETHQCPEDREDPGGSEDEEAAQRLRVVGLHHLDDTQQGLDPRSPQMAHVQSFQVHQAGPRATDNMKMCFI